MSSCIAMTKSACVRPTSHYSELLISTPTAVAARGVGFFISVYLFFPIDISKTDASRVTKLDKEMFHDEFWKLTYVDIKRSNVKVASHKNIAGVGLCILVSAAGFFQSVAVVRGSCSCRVCLHGVISDTRFHASLSAENWPTNKVVWVDWNLRVTRNRC